MRFGSIGVAPSDRIGFAVKSTAGLAADFRAIAGKLGRQDAIPAFNARLEQANGHGRTWIMTAIRALYDPNPERVIRYLTKGGVPYTPSKRRHRRSRDHAEHKDALAPPDPFAGPLEQ